jgi:hypothetical protein
VPAFDVYSRQGCHLCELLIEDLAGLVGNAATIRVHDVDTRPEWRERYGNDVPVVEMGGQELCRHRLDVEALRAALAACR